SPVADASTTRGPRLRELPWVHGIGFAARRSLATGARLPSSQRETPRHEVVQHPENALGNSELRLPILAPSAVGETGGSAGSLDHGWHPPRRHAPVDLFHHGPVVLSDRHHGREHQHGGAITGLFGQAALGAQDRKSTRLNSS